MKPVRSRRQPWRIRILMSAVGATLGASSMGFGQTAASWIGGSSGSWTESAKWSTTPFYPTQDNPSGTTYDAIINSPSHAFIVLNSAVTLNSLTMDSPSLLRLGGGARLQAATITINSGSIETLGGAEIYNSTLRTSGADRRFYLGAVLNASTIGNSMAIGDVLVRNGLNLQNASLSAQLSFDGSQTLGGIGTVALSDYTPLMINSGTAVFDSGITLLSNTDVGDIGGNGDYVSPGAWINRGTIINSKLLQLTGNWRNEGTLVLNGGEILLNGQFTSSGIGTVHRTSGTLVLLGDMDNTGSVFRPDSLGTPIDMRTFNGTPAPIIRGGTVVFSATTPMTIGGGARFEDVTIDGEWVVASQPRVKNLSIAANSKVRVQGALFFGVGQAAGAGAQPLTGKGELALEGGFLDGTNVGIRIGPEMTVSGAGTIYGSQLINQGTIAAQQSTLYITSPLQNQGLLKAGTGGFILLTSNITTANLGQFDSTGGRIDLLGSLDNAGNNLVLNGIGNTLRVAGQISGGTITAINGAKVFAGANNAPTIVNTRLNADLYPQGDLILATGTKMGPGFKVHMPYAVRLQFDSLFTGEVLLEDNSSPFSSVIGTLANQTVNAGVVLRTNGGNGTFGGDSASAYTTNSYGFFSAETPGNTLAIYGSNLTFNNFGTLGVSNGTLTSDANLINSGTINLAGGTLNLRGTWNNAAGTLNMSGGQLNLGGTFDVTKVGTFIRTGGSVALTGTFNNINSTADLASSFGTWTLAPNATIVGGSIVAPAPSTPFSVNNGTLNLIGSSINSDVVLANGAKLNLTGAWSNHNVISGNSGSVLLGGTFVQSSIGTMDVSDIYVTGTFNNNANNLLINDLPTMHVISGGTITGGTISSVGDASLLLRSGMLSSLTLKGRLALEPAGAGEGARRLINVINDGTIVIPPNTALLNPSLTNTRLTSVAGGNVTLTSNWTNTGTIQLNDGTLKMNLVTGSQINAGTLNGAGTLLLSGNFSTADLGYMSRGGGYTALVTGTFNNTGQTFNIDGTGTWAVYQGYPGARIIGGTFASSNGGELEIANPIPYTLPVTLESITATTDVRVRDGADVEIVGGLKLLSNARVLLGDGNTSSISRLVSTGEQTISGLGEILLETGNTVPNRGGYVVNSSTLTLGSGITLRTGTGSGTIGYAGNRIINQGTISAQSANRKIQMLGVLDNQGTIRAANGGVVVLPPPASLVNYSNGTLNGGTWIVEGNSTLDFGSATFMTNKATIILDGPQAKFPGINGFLLNRGSLTLVHGSSMSILNTLGNTGQIYIGPDSTLAARFALTSSGTIDLNNKLTVQYAPSASPLGNIIPLLASQHILSSTALADPSHAIGYGDDGQTVTLQLTFGGDTNLDQIVDLSDLYQLASHWQSSGTWPGGDFNYDGFVNSADLTILARNWQAGVDPGTPTLPLNSVLASLGLPEVSVPEPMLLSAVAAGTLLLRRRRVTIA